MKNNNGWLGRNYSNSAQLPLRPLDDKERRIWNSAQNETQARWLLKFYRGQRGQQVSQAAVSGWNQ